jgi:hypothetical protein
MMSTTVGNPVPVSRTPSALNALGQYSLVVFFAAAYCLPCLVHGLPLSGDSTLHTTFQHQFSGQFWNGDIYPRWMMNANRGYGSPIFLIQYPLPYWVTALLRFVTRFPATPYRESRELGIYCFIALALAGVNARIWLRNKGSSFAATAAAILYISLPFILPFELYTDFGLGQFTVFAWMPLALVACDSLRPNFRSIVFLGFAWALLALSNLLTALIFAPFMIVYAVARTRTGGFPVWRCLLDVFLSIGVGSCMAAVYLLPFAAYSRLFNVSAMQNQPGYHVSDYFSYVRTATLGKPLIAASFAGSLLVAVVAVWSVWRGSGNFIVRVVISVALGMGALMAIPGLGLRFIAAAGLTMQAYSTETYFPERLLAMTLLMLALGALAYSRVEAGDAKLHDWTNNLLLVTACVAFFGMLPWSAFLWSAFPIVATAIQFPFRLGVVLTIAVAGLLAPAIDAGLRSWPSGEGKRSTILLACVSLAVVAGGFLTWRADWRWFQVLRTPPLVHTEESHPVDNTYLTYVSPDHLARFTDIIKPPAQGSVVNQVVAPGTGRVIHGDGIIQVVRQGPRQVLISYQVATETQAQIGLLYSPLWKIESTDGVPSSDSVECSPDGLVQLTLGAGQHALELVFDVGWPEKYGKILTYASLFVVVVGLLYGRWKREEAEDSQAG